MRVLLLITRPQRRGAEVFAQALAGALVERGHESRLIALYGGGAEAAALALQPGDVALDGRAHAFTERIQPNLLRRLLEEVERFEPDILQASGSSIVKYPRLLRRRRSRAPWALVSRSIGTPADWLRGSLHDAPYRCLMVSQVNGIIAVNAIHRLTGGL